VVDPKDGSRLEKIGTKVLELSHLFLPDAMRQEALSSTRGTSPDLVRSITEFEAKASN